MEKDDSVTAGEILQAAIDHPWEHGSRPTQGEVYSSSAAMSEKKRKRTSETVDRPGKKVAVAVAVDAPPSVVKVSVIANSDEWTPVIGMSGGSVRPGHPDHVYRQAVKIDADPLQHPHQASPSRRRLPSNPTAKRSVMHLYAPQPTDQGIPPNSFYTPQPIPKSTTLAARRKKLAATASSNTMSASTTPKRASYKSCKHGS